MEEKDKLKEETAPNAESSPGETAAEEDAKEDAKEKEPAASAASHEEEKESGKKGHRKKQKPDKHKEQIDALNDRILRQQAEFENFRKRTEKEKSQMFEVGARSVIEKILPIVDNFERGLAAVPESERDTPVVEGFNMIYKQLMGELDGLGVKVIESVGLPFDPDRHNAVMQVSSDEHESGIVASELQKGYTYRESVVRYSMVSVTE